MVRLDDMRLFASVAKQESLTAAANALGLSKQTVSRRLSELESALGVQLVHRSTRVVALTDVGEAYAARCAEVVELADDAHRAVTDVQSEPAGTLRVTADPHFGDAFLGPILVEYAQRCPEVELDVVLTRRHVDLVAEGFDVAFRAGTGDGPGLTTTRLGPARIRYCASPDYVRARGNPDHPSELAKHQCVLMVHEGRPNRWPFAAGSEVRLQSVEGRLRFTSFELARQAVLAGLGIGLFPEYACLDDLASGHLVTVLDDHAMEVGGVNLVTPTQRFLAARVKALIDIATARFQDAPWAG